MIDSNNKILIGNKNNIEYFENVINSNKLLHAYTISGPEKSGKNTLVFSVISMLLKRDNIPLSIMERIKEGICPDVRIIDKEEGKKSIGIDQVREGLRDSKLTPFELTFKVYIIRNADTMTVQAQNSLLKSIEEPNDGVYYFLLVKNSSFLLPTINSRTQKISVELFEKQELEDIIRSNYDCTGFTDEEIKFSVRFSQGSLGRAIQLLNENTKEIKLYKDIKAILFNLSQKGLNYTYFQFAVDMDSLIKSNKKDKTELRLNYNLILSYFLLGFRDIVSVKISDSKNLVFFSYDELINYVQKFNLNNLQSCINVISDQQLNAKINYNINIALKKLTINLWHSF